jgi:tRNA G18 (ribose-2'-O)-methylase SpoU
VVALETVSTAPYAHKFAFPPPPTGCALVLGNERHGIAPELLARCDAVVRLPCRGKKNSLNVAVALGMCAHEIARQWDADGG